MRIITNSKILRVWDQGLSQEPLQQALTLLSLDSDVSDRNPGNLSIGQRDARLFRLYKHIFGLRLNGLTVCPECRETLEMSFNAGDLQLREEELPETLSVSKNGYEVLFRLPSSHDLEEISALPADDAKTALLEQCLLAVSRGGKRMSFSKMPSEVFTAVSEGMEAADPHANITLSIDCPSCHHHWEALFDIASFFWSELNSWARRLLREVHILALAYGWDEENIVEMSSTRRKIYLEMVSG